MKPDKPQRHLANIALAALQSDLSTYARATTCYDSLRLIQARVDELAGYLTLDTCSDTVLRLQAARIAAAAFRLTLDFFPCPDPNTPDRQPHLPPADQPPPTGPDDPPTDQP